MTLPCALTVAGSDSSGGAGIQADLKTFAALHVYGASAITALTAQNTRGVFGIFAAPPEFVAQQIDVVCEDLPIRAVKTGMLGSAPLIEAVALSLQRQKQKQRHGFPIVVDPVMVAKSGDALLPDDAVDALKKHLLPCAAVVTPNLPEAARLLGFDVRSVQDQERAGRGLLELGAQAALVKGGHARGDPIDVLVTKTAVVRIPAQRIVTQHTHGTGCTYAAAIAAYLARGFVVEDAVRRAHGYVQLAIAQAPGLGHGHGPLHHLHPFYPA